MSLFNCTVTRGQRFKRDENNLKKSDGRWKIIIPWNFDSSFLFSFWFCEYRPTNQWRKKYYENYKISRESSWSRKRIVWTNSLNRLRSHDDYNNNNSPRTSRTVYKKLTGIIDRATKNHFEVTVYLRLRRFDNQELILTLYVLLTWPDLV